jgi:hypothetical protein
MNALTAETGAPDTVLTHTSPIFFETSNSVHLFYTLIGCVKRGSKMQHFYLCDATLSFGFRLILRLSFRPLAEPPTIGHISVLWMNHQH